MKNIAKKILLVQQEVKYISKNARNDFHKYDYATEADVLQIKEVMNRHGLIAFPTLVGYETIQYANEKGEMKMQVLQQIKYTVIDSDSGEMVESVVLGQGEDKGDKAAYKAATGASKYFHLKFAGAATGDDPERESQVPSKNVGQHSEAQKPQQQAPAQPAPQPNDLEKRRAQVAANKILHLQKQYNLSDNEVKDYCNIKSLSGLLRAGAAGTLEKAVERLQNRMRMAAY